MDEATIVAAAQRELRAIGAVVVKIHGGPYQPDLNDLVGCHRGRAFMLEGKRPGEPMTPRQRVRSEQWKAAGAITGVFTSAGEAVALVTGGQS
jgi:hypothetical protein